MAHLDKLLRDTNSDHYVIPLHTPRTAQVKRHIVPSIGEVMGQLKL